MAVPQVLEKGVIRQDTDTYKRVRKGVFFYWAAGFRLPFGANQPLLRSEQVFDFAQPVAHRTDVRGHTRNRCHMRAQSYVYIFICTYVHTFISSKPQISIIPPRQMFVKRFFMYILHKFCPVTLCKTTNANFKKSACNPAQNVIT